MDIIFFAPVSRTVLTSAWNPGVVNPSEVVPPFFHIDQEDVYGSL
jgi:hypothetical protein